MTADIQDVEQRIVRIYRELSPGGQPPDEQGRGELDSMAFLDFIVMLEEEFGVEIPTEAITEENFATTQSTAAFICSATGQREATDASPDSR